MNNFFHIIITKSDPYSSGEEHLKSVFGTNKDTCIAEAMKWLRVVLIPILQDQVEQFKRSYEFCPLSENLQRIKKAEQRIIDIDAELKQISTQLSNSTYFQQESPPELIGHADICWHELYLYKLSG